MGFRSPEQTLTTFQTGWRAGEWQLEYRCLSQAFIRRNSISGLLYLEFREKLQDQTPFLRTALVKAEIESVERRGPRARATLASFGRRFVVDLVLEEFAQLYAGEELVLDREAPFDEWTSVAPAGNERWFTGGAPLPPDRDGTEITELRLGREWKIDNFLGEPADSEEPPPDP